MGEQVVEIVAWKKSMQHTCAVSAFRPMSALIPLGVSVSMLAYSTMHASIYMQCRYKNMLLESSVCLSQVFSNGSTMQGGIIFNELSYALWLRSTVRQFV